ncbi:hypothetical protein WICMUC_001367 [Wickerhamomyces mucosus]|uniref:RNA polymerase II transcription factor B subunit 3 n=1 Tax=Wickerhamomyces mucosus TaxID=1378264 RepID=A0A9P8TGC0_9ASCO|nr:hypothetical protein WICMUC_001367 [Wickerhamomyces mucosus]
MADVEERQKDMCPICKTDRYLSPDMKFLVNPECYHKMCESCVDRIYSLGPAPCPYPNCGKTLRKNRFKLQIFDDILVEKEIDIRNRILSIYNKIQDDFDDLQSYNSYLEEVEEMIFNLMNGIDIVNTETKLKQYKEENLQKIDLNNNNREKEFEDFKKREEFEKNLKIQKLQLERQIEIEEKQLNELAKKEILNKLTTSNDINQTISQVKASVLKKSSARRKQLKEIMTSLQNSNNPQQEQHQESSSSSIPFTPFNGDRELKQNFNKLSNYYDPFIDELKLKKDYIAAGWKSELVYERILNEAFIGIGCFIQDEKKNSILLSS